MDVSAEILQRAPRHRPFHHETQTMSQPPSAFKPFRSELPTVLIVSTGFHLYREYLMQQMVEHANLWLLLDAEPTWQTPYIGGFTLTDTLDADRMIEASRALAGTVPIDGVICWDEIRMVPTS